MRTNLKVFRIKHQLTQAEFAAKLGCCRATYALIERGERSGSAEFWSNLQKEFDVADADMYSLMKVD